MPINSANNMFHQAKLLFAVIFVQSSYAGLVIITMFALKQGMSHYVFVVYRMVIASAIIAPFAFVLDRKLRPKLTFSILVKIMLLGLFDPVLDQNLYYIGMKNTTATFTSAMCNMLPAFAFVMACIFRLEVVNFRRLQSLAKVLGTIGTVGGAMMMTLVKGPLLNLPWTRGRHQHFQSEGAENQQDFIKGTLAIIASCFCWACFVTLQAFTLRSYPAQLSLTALICISGLVEGTIVALIVEWRNNAAWSIHLDAKLLAAIYGGILSVLQYYVMGLVSKEKGPVFYSAFNPLTTILVAILSSIIIAEEMFLGRVIGAIIIIGGLYLVLWGKSKDKRRVMSHSEDEATNDDQDKDVQPSTTV